MMHRHFRVPPATTNTTANANADGARTGSKSQQDTFDDYLYLTQLQQARLPRPCPTSPDLLGARPPSPGLAPHSRASSLLQGRLLCYSLLTTHCRRAATRPPSRTGGGSARRRPTLWVSSTGSSMTSGLARHGPRSSTMAPPRQGAVPSNTPGYSPPIHTHGYSPRHTWLQPTRHYGYRRRTMPSAAPSRRCYSAPARTPPPRLPLPPPPPPLTGGGRLAGPVQLPLRRIRLAT